MLNTAQQKTAGTEVLDFDAFVRLMDGNKSARFASLLYRSKESGELARYTILLNAKYDRCLRADVAKLEAMLPTLTGLDKQAAEELLASKLASLNGTQTGYTRAGTCEAQGNGNVQVSTKHVVYIRGFRVSKETIEEGTFKMVKSAAKTIAKNKIRKQLKSDRCRDWIVSPENFRLARHEGKTIIIDATLTALNKLANLPPVTLAKPSQPIPA
jgi:hypothetical protein